jgi:hypothetical protein
MADPLSPVPPAVDPGVASPVMPRPTPTAPQAPAVPPPADSLDTLARPPEAAALAPLPAALAALVPGARLAGVVVAAPRQPVSLRTPHGEAALAATAVLEAGTALVLEVVAAEQRLVAVPVSVDGEPAPSLAPAVVTLGPAADDPLPAPLPAMPRGARLVGTVVPLPDPRIKSGGALFVSDAAVLRLEPGPVAAAKLRLPTGARLEVEVVQAATHLVTRIVSPAEVALPAPARAVLGPLAAARGAAARASAPASTLARGLSLGQTITATVVQATGTGAAAGTRLALTLRGYGAAAAPDGAPMRAEVVGHDHGGALLVRIAETVLRLPTDAPLPPATILAFEVAAPPAPAGEAVASAEAPRLEALALAAAGPAPVAAAVAEAVPNTTPRAIANLISYLLGLRSGDARPPGFNPGVGERAGHALERAGRADLIERLGEELRTLGRGGREPAGEWRQLPLPWHDGGRLHFPVLWLHEHHRPAGADRETEPGTRLVVDVRLSRLGPLQIDGFYRKGRFDVAVRTRDPLAQAIRRNLRAIYGDVLAVAGLGGSLAFQVTGGPPSLGAAP